jgi:hypothetical protein
MYLTHKTRCHYFKRRNPFWPSNYNFSLVLIDFLCSPRRTPRPCVSPQGDMGGAPAAGAGFLLFLHLWSPSLPTSGISSKVRRGGSISPNNLDRDQVRVKVFPLSHFVVWEICFLLSANGDETGRLGSFHEGLNEEGDGRQSCVQGSDSWD